MRSVERKPIVVIALLIGGIWQSAAADQIVFPFDAYVVAATNVRSGPNDSFFVTQQIPKQTKVSVYLITESGWCAIRPLEDSFSWVRRDQVEITDRKDVLRVISPGVFSRVGTHLTDLRNVRTVDLQVGDLLGVADMKTSNDRWVKIQPPAGEFRWVHRNRLDRFAKQAAKTESMPQTDRESDSDKTSSPHTSATSRVAPSLLTKEFIDLDPPAATKGKMVTEPIPVEPQPLAIPESLVAQIEAPRRDEVTQTSGWIANTDPAVDLQEPAAIASTQEPALDTVAPVDFDAQLGRINAELSKMIAKDQKDWDFANVQRKAEAVVEFAQNPKYRTAAQKLLRRIHQFEAVKLNVANVDSPPSELPLSPRDRLADKVKSDNRIQRTNHELPDRSPREEPAVRQKVPRYHQFDGYGWLMPVYSTRRELPKFALTNRQGTILAFVSPNAGLNLRPYLKKRVGLIGSRASRPVQQKPHLSVARVVVLDKKRR